MSRSYAWGVEQGVHVSSATAVQDPAGFSFIRPLLLVVDVRDMAHPLSPADFVCV